MSAAEILDQLPRLQPAERRELLDRLYELCERDMLQGDVPTAEERAILDEELEEFRRNPTAGESWNDVQARLRKISGQ